MEVEFAFQYSAAGGRPWRSNMLRAEIQRALRRAPRQLRGLGLGLQTRAGLASRRRTRETMFAFAAVCLARFFLRLQPLESSLGRVPQATDCACEKIANRIVSVAEDCLSPERTFHG